MLLSLLTSLSLCFFICDLGSYAAVDKFYINVRANGDIAYVDGSTFAIAYYGKASAKDVFGVVALDNLDEGVEVLTLTLKYAL